MHLVCWTARRDAGDSNPARVEILFKISFPHAPLANWTLMSSWAHCQWDDETVRKRIGHPPSYAKAKKMKSLTLHTHGCHIASLRECSFLVFFVLIVIISLLFFYCYYFSLLVYIYVFIAIISLLLFLFLLLLFLFFYFCFYCYYFSSSIFVFLVIISLLLFFWLLLLLFLFFCFWLLVLLFFTSLFLVFIVIGCDFLGIDQRRSHMTAVEKPSTCLSFHSVFLCCFQVGIIWLLLTAGQKIEARRRQLGREEFLYKSKK